MKTSDVGGLIALVSMILALVALVGLIKPKIFFGARNRKWPGFGLVGCFVGFMAGGAIISNSQDKEATASPPAAAAPKSPAPVQQAAVAPPPPPRPAASIPPPAAKLPAPAAMPATELKFLSAVLEARQAYRAAKNEMAQGGTRAQRRAAICSALGAGVVDGWIGIVTAATSANDGRGVLAIKIDDKIEVKTWNNSLSDSFDHTLIEAGSPVFKQAVELAKGDTVRFGGIFIADDKDCVRESSMTLGGSMTEPEFLFRFTSLKKI